MRCVAFSFLNELLLVFWMCSADIPTHTSLLKNHIFIGGVFEFVFPRVYCYPIKAVFIIFRSKLFCTWSSSKTICVYSSVSFCLGLFWDCLLLFRMTFHGILCLLFNESQLCIRNIFCCRRKNFCDYNFFLIFCIRDELFVLSNEEILSCSYFFSSTVRFISKIATLILYPNQNYS